jgi:uncharacterized protein
MHPLIADWLVLAAAVAAGAAVQAATGFGFAILAAPVFLAVLNSTSAVPILVALHVVQCMALVPRFAGGVPWPQLRGLALGALVGCPLGLLVFHALDVRLMKLAIGVTILFVAAMLAWRRLRPAIRNAGTSATDSIQRSSLALGVTGALSGALTAMLVMPGPPLMVHLLRHPLPPAPARSLSIMFFAGCYVAVLLAHVITGSLGSEDWRTILRLTVPVLVGTYAGLRLAPWLAERHFAPVLNGLLLLAGLGALWSAL